MLPLRSVLGVGFLVIAGCAPAERAGAKAPPVADACEGIPAQAADALPLYSPSHIERIEPLYVKRPAGKLEYERLGGVRLTVKSPRGLTRDDFQRTLECHVARAGAGELRPDARPQDPLVLASGRPQVLVEALSPRGFSVRIEGDSREAAHEILSRAQALAPEKAVAVD